MAKIVKIIALILIVGFTGLKASAQSSTSGANTVTTAVPFLSITPDSRAGAMGDAGVATTPDINSQHWNPAKYAFMESHTGVALSFTPWLRKLVNDMNIGYLVGYLHLDDKQTISGSVRYFAMGDITFRSNDANDPGFSVNPNEFAVDFGYSRLLSEKFSGAVAVRYIHSNITAGRVDGAHAGNSFAADVAFYFTEDFKVNRKNSTLSAGINISNIGAKISYEDGKKDFLPTNLRLGVAYAVELDKYNKIQFSGDINKLLVPTPSQDVVINEGEVVVTYDLGQDESVIGGMFSSFGDAPGGFKEELQEITLSLGAEYIYNDQFAIRAGYFYEHENKGNRKFITAGAGLKMNVISLDFAYLLPTQSNHPLESTLRFSLGFDLGGVTSARGKRRK